MISEDVVFNLSEDVQLALPAAGFAQEASVGEWLVAAGLVEIADEADVGTWLSNMGSGALNFGTTGATIGGPWGALIGGLLGAGLGAAQTVASDQPKSPPPVPQKPPAAPPQKPPAPQPTQPRPPVMAYPAVPGFGPPAPSPSSTDLAALVAALRDVLPALTVLASQLNRSEAVDGEWPSSVVAPDWSMEPSWPYAADGVDVDRSEGEQAEERPAEDVAPKPAEDEAATESADPEAAPETAESAAASEDEDPDEAVSRLAPAGEAYAGAGLAALGEDA